MRYPPAHFTEPTTPPGFTEPGLFRLTMAERAQIDEDEAREDAGHACQCAADDAALMCDQPAYRYRAADPAEVAALTARFRALRDEARRVFSVPSWEG